MNAIRFTFTYLVASLIACAGHVAMAQQATGEAGAVRASEATTAGDTNSVIGRFPPGSIQSVESADIALADAEKERSAIEARFTQEKQACMPKFFASSCVDEAKERRRHALLKLRPVEIEANTFKRTARVKSRDEALEKRRQKDADAGIDRDASSTPAPFGAEAVPPTDADARAGRKPPKKAGVDRAARHEERVTRTPEEERAEEAMRAKNVVDYEKKVKAAEARQQEIARRKAEKYQKIEEKRKLKDGAIQPPGSPSATSSPTAPNAPAAPATPATTPTPAPGKAQ
ncbi:hypothetical protein [Noviherbaspirillum sp. Root189]|uniref:hypothetical protein n=1 Tax=Noviherbaspirillum sp. Root189 TaxID=1736487 RepID=UPI00070BD918|nr:hypothetical protein [Noviherbaspirillum sp. Root189]KRB84502.1 hypothetical protein ASE07_03635 [Noviherbaspirillum sp. Root189]